MAYYPRPNRNHVKIKSQKLFVNHSKTVNTQPKSEPRIVKLPPIPECDSAEFYAQAASRLFSAIAFHATRKQQTNALLDKSKI